MSEYIKSLKNTVNRKLDNIWQISKGDLKTIVEITGGESLKSNINLVFNYCRLASNIAKEYSK